MKLIWCFFVQLLSTCLGEETIVENEDGTDEGWVETHHFDASANGLEDKVRDMTLDGNKNDNGGDMEEEMDRVSGSGGEDDEDGEAADMEDFEESGMLDAVDPVCIPFWTSSTSARFVYLNRLNSFDIRFGLYFP